MESTEIIKEDASERESDEIEVSSATHDKKAEAITDDSRQNYRTAIASHFLFRVHTDPVHEEAFSILKKLQVLCNSEPLPTRFSLLNYLNHAS